MVFRIFSTICISLVLVQIQCQSIPKEISVQSITPIYLRLESGHLLIGNRKVFTPTPPTYAHTNIAYEFFGIPFAEPPLKEKRYKLPVRLTSTFPQNSVTYNATYKRLQCVQTSKKPSSEDCLYFNVWVPVTKEQDELIYLNNSKRFENNLNGLKHVPNAFLFKNAAPKTSMFWIHGGYLEIGSGNDEDGSILATVENVIVVATNYRLGNDKIHFLNRVKFFLSIFRPFK
jgi:hypothetical protein